VPKPSRSKLTWLQVRSDRKYTRPKRTWPEDSSAQVSLYPKMLMCNPE